MALSGIQQQRYIRQVVSCTDLLEQVRPRARTVSPGESVPRMTNCEPVMPTGVNPVPGGFPLASTLVPSMIRILEDGSIAVQPVGGVSSKYQFVLGG